MAKKKLPQSVKDLIAEVQPQLSEAVQGIQLDAEHHQEEAVKSNIKWDVPTSQKVQFFDPTLSYELTGYRPVDEERGLDFDPEWFMEARRVKESTGKYCAYPVGTKKYNDFWQEQYKRCNEGYWSHGYRITGDNYFFLNFYRLKNVKVKKAAAGRDVGFPDFFSKQYEYFHYIDLCERTGHDVCALKSRGVGQY